MEPEGSLHCFLDGHGPTEYEEREVSYKRVSTDGKVINRTVFCARCGTLLSNNYYEEVS
jgi:ribosomal protein S27AE